MKTLLKIILLVFMGNITAHAESSYSFINNNTSYKLRITNDIDWILKKDLVYGTKSYSICQKNDLEKCLNIERGRLIKSKIKARWKSALWSFVKKGNFYYIRNLWKPNQYIMADPNLNGMVYVTNRPANHSLWKAIRINNVSDLSAYNYTDYALLSKEIYNNKSNIGNWKRVKDYSYSGLHLSVYQENKTKQYAIVFEGTKFYSIHDLTTNAEQLANFNYLPIQYAEARDYVKKLLLERKYQNAILTGHSLGGGLAQYVARSFDMKAYIFNPAGLSSNTVNNAKTHLYNYTGADKMKKKITSIISRNGRGSKDPVSRFGDLLGVKKFMYVKENGSLDLHNISNLHYALNYHGNKLQAISTRINYFYEKYPNYFGRKSEELYSCGTYYTCQNFHTKRKIAINNKSKKLYYWNKKRWKRWKN